MTYLNTHTRTTTPTSSDKFQPIGRSTALFGVFIGFVKDLTDVQKNGRLRVWIPELGSAPDNPDGWIIVNYCSPFAGSTNNETTSKANVETFEGTQTSYGLWMIPPDINNQVLVMFINGDPGRGIWIGSMYDQFMNNMVPAMASDSKNWQYPGKQVPVAEYNKWDTRVTQPDRAFHPFEQTKFKGVGNQGLIADPSRGTTTSSARRESPSNVFGILTPGPAINPDVKPEDIRRKGGSSFTMDDGTGTEYIEHATKSGAKVRIDETHGFVYLINRDGTSWVQMDKDGNIDIFGAGDISMRAQRDINLRADRNINIEAGQNLFMKAAQDTKEETTTFTYDVNNVPTAKTIPVWSYVGEGKGQGGNIVMQSMNNWQSTTQKGAFLTVVENNMNVKIGNALSVTTVNGGQDYNSKQGIKMTTDAAFDLAATGNIRVGSKGSISVVGISDVIVCSSAGISLNATNDIKAISASNILLTSLNIDTSGSDMSFNGTLSIAGLTKLSGGLSAAGPVALGGSVPFTPVPANNPTASEGAQSAGTARPAEIKPLNNKINILATWKDPESKFRRNSQALLTTTSRFPTFEPCPEHEAFSLSSVAGYSPIITPDDKTYEGSAGVGNSAEVSPAAAVNPGANNTSIVADPPGTDAVTKDMNMNALRCQLIIHEGLKNRIYKDSLGLPTGGIGHLLRDNEIARYPLDSPISAEQIETWFSQDTSTAIKDCQVIIGDTWGNLSDIRKRALVDLSYNLGKTRFAKFTMFLAAIKAENFAVAGNELRNSKWFSQVGRRGPNVVTMITQNVDTTGCDKRFPG